MTWNPHEQYAQDADCLPIVEPPCKGCANWRPVRQHDSAGRFLGVRLCQADEMHLDFSCFSARVSENAGAKTLHKLQAEPA
jgi:hypothetical protein